MKGCRRYQLTAACGHPRTGGSLRGSPGSNAREKGPEPDASTRGNEGCVDGSGPELRWRPRPAPFPTPTSLILPARVCALPHFGGKDWPDARARDEKRRQRAAAAIHGTHLSGGRMPYRDSGAPRSTIRIHRRAMTRPGIVPDRSGCRRADANPDAGGRLTFVVGAGSPGGRTSPLLRLRADGSRCAPPFTESPTCR